MVYVVVFALEPVAVFADRQQAERMADAIGADVRAVPVLLFDMTAPQGPKNGD